MGLKTRMQGFGMSTAVMSLDDKGGIKAGITVKHNEKPEETIATVHKNTFSGRVGI